MGDPGTAAVDAHGRCDVVEATVRAGYAFLQVAHACPSTVSRQEHRSIAGTRHAFTKKNIQVLIFINKRTVAVDNNLPPAPCGVDASFDWDTHVKKRSAACED